MIQNKKMLSQLEEELHTETLPGTEIMTDVASHYFVKTGASKAEHEKSQVLVPQPSDDLHDPLNWNQFWKTSVIVMSTAVSFAQGMGPLALAPMFPQLMDAFDRSLADVVQFTGVCILVLGFSNFIWVPIQTSFGRRPVLIASTLICLVSNIWRAVATDYASFMGACVLNGIGAGPAETAQPQIIADVMFLHERGRWNTLYFTFYFGSLMVGPIIAGPMAEHVGWRSFWWLNVAMHGVIFVLLFFLFPETKWHRALLKEVSHQAPVTTGTKAHIQAPSPSPTTNGTENHVEPDLVVAPTTHPYLNHGVPSKQQFAFYQPTPNPFNSILKSLYIPWHILLFPIVQFSAFTTSWSASTFLTVNLTQSQSFAAPPYTFNSQNIGFTNFATLVGAGIGLLSNGWLSDWTARRLTRRNGGVREPEMRLPALIPFTLVMVLGNLVVAFGYQRHWPWEVIVLIGYTCVGIQVAAIPAIATTYAVDSYKPVAGSIMVAVTVNKNVWGYGVSKFITPWIEEVGYLEPILVNMGLNLLWCGFGVVFYVWGKRFRGWTRDSRVHGW